MEFIVVITIITFLIGTISFAYPQSHLEIFQHLEWKHPRWDLRFLHQKLVKIYLKIKI